MFEDLRGRVALVTGASSGLGAHFAALLADQGCRVALAARRKDRLAEHVAAISAAGGTAMAVEMDVTDPGSVGGGLAGIEALFGPVELLVNNAGLASAHGFLNAPARKPNGSLP